MFSVRRYMLRYVLMPVLLITGLFAGPVANSEEERKILTVDTLLNNGFSRLSGEQIFEIMRQKVIKVTDIATDAVVISRQEKSGRGMEREFKDKKKDHSLYFLDTRLLARAPALEGKIKRKVEGDELVATDGLRTYRYSVYQKLDRMFAVRDIDNGNVFYEVKVE